MSTANLTDHEALPPFLYRSGPSIDPHHREHVVQFYIDDASLLDGLSRFIGIALAAGDGALVIATKAHRDGLTQRLKARGMDPARPAATGRFITLDAGETLSKVMWERVRDLNGDLQLDSDYRGTSVRIRIPVKPDRQPGTMGS
jgi:MEDS: MEthanogen/methylotroph, DcmR Sensory domain